MELHKKLDTLIAKATKLASENKRLAGKNTELLGEIDKLRQEVEAGRQKAEELNNQIKIVKLAQNIGSAKAETIEIKELKQKLNEYIKEIDNCMAILNE